MATYALKSSTILCLLLNAGQLLLDLFRQSLLIRYWHRIQRLPSSLTHATVFKELIIITMSISRIHLIILGSE